MVAQLDEALRYKPKSSVRSPMEPLRFFIGNLSGRNMTLGSTQPLTEMGTRDSLWE